MISLFEVRYTPQIPSMSSPLLRLIQNAAPKKANNSRMITPRYTLQISCVVKPNVSNNREGITAVGSEKVSVCVAAAPKNGEANTAVSQVFAEILSVPKSNVDVTKGLKSRDKTLSISDFDIGTKSEATFLRDVHRKLVEAIRKSY